MANRRGSLTWRSTPVPPQDDAADADDVNFGNSGYDEEDDVFTTTTSARRRAPAKAAGDEARSGGRLKATPRPVASSPPTPPRPNATSGCTCEVTSSMRDLKKSAADSEEAAEVACRQGGRS